MPPNKPSDKPTQRRRRKSPQDVPLETLVLVRSGFEDPKPALVFLDDAVTISHMVANCIINDWPVWDIGDSHYVFPTGVVQTEVEE